MSRLLSITIDDNDCAVCMPSFVECCAHVESLSIRNTGLTDSLAKVTSIRDLGFGIQGSGSLSIRNTGLTDSLAKVTSLRIHDSVLSVEG
jgi:hypothetical protein